MVVIAYLFLALAMSLQLGESVPVADEAPEVSLPNLGTLRGSVGTSAFSGRKILQFLSVKYGETTAGEYRFKVICIIKITSYLTLDKTVGFSHRGKHYLGKECVMCQDMDYHVPS